MFEQKFIPSLIFVTVGFVGKQIYSSISYDEFIYLMMYIFASVLSYALTNTMIPIIQKLNLKADLFGMDINKKGI